MQSNRTNSDFKIRAPTFESGRASYTQDYVPHYKTEAQRPWIITEECNFCEKPFGTFERRRFCSWCSRSCCKECTTELPQPDNKEARQCDYCNLKIKNP
jgi:hypothetical protein